MTGDVRFETPENINVSYAPTGLGTRFIAWFVDEILMTFAFLLLVCVGSALAFQSLLEGFDLDPADAAMYIFGVLVLIWNLASFVYFGCFELFMRGQTPGKRSAGVRVVKADGFSLDPFSVLVRNVFRLVDQLPPLWIVPLLSEKGQRFGDMAAGTLVVVEAPVQISSVRDVLSSRPAPDSKFRFDGTALERLHPQDFAAVEQFLERWGRLNQMERDRFSSQIVPALAKRLDADLPEPGDRIRFLEDLLAAEYRRQSRSLG